MSRTVKLTVTLNLELASRLSRSEFYDELPRLLRMGLGEILVPAMDAVSVIAANDPEQTLSQPVNLAPLLEPWGEIAFIWSVEDVKEVRPDLTDGQAMEVLRLNQRTHDANYGVSWDTLAYAAEALFGEAPEPAEIG